MIDFDALMLNPIFATLGVPGVIILLDSREFNLTVIDNSSGVDVGNNVQVPTVLPAAAIRYAELVSLGLSPDDLINATLSMNGFTWTITNFKKNPNPSGEKAGELFAILTQSNEDVSSS